MKVALHFLDDPSFNAFAATTELEDIICINRGVIPILTIVSRALASQPTFMPSRHSQGIKTEARSIAVDPHMDYSGIDWSASTLEDAAREILATSLTRLCMIYILQHEFAHIYNGHIDYLNDTEGLSLLAELVSVTIPSPVSTDRETLEFDADQCAVIDLLRAALSPEVRFEGERSAWAVPEENMFGSINESVELVFAASIICSVLFAAGDPSSPVDPGPRSHPHPLFRYFMMCGQIATTLPYRTGTPLETWMPAFDEAISNTLSAATKAFSNSPLGPKPGQENSTTKEEFDAAYAGRKAGYRRTWAELHPKLDKHKRGGMIAPITQTRHPAFPDNDVLG